MARHFSPIPYPGVGLTILRGNVYTDLSRWELGFSWRASCPPEVGRLFYALPQRTQEPDEPCERKAILISDVPNYSGVVDCQINAFCEVGITGIGTRAHQRQV